MNEELIENLEEVREQVDFYADKFSEWYGVSHLILARHAAFPVSITVDLLYQVWANFKSYPDDQGIEQVIPMLAVSDLLLSSLFRQTGRDIYEMQPEVRAYLLGQLKSDPRFGENRIQQLASFLYRYIQEQPDRPEWKNFKEAQKWTAFLSTDPVLAAENILQSLINKVSKSQVNSSIGIANMIEAFAKDNDGFAQHVAERLQAPQDKDKEPLSTGDATGDTSTKKLVLADKAMPGNLTFSINLPPHISKRLTGIKAAMTSIPATEPEKKGTVYGLFVGISEYPESRLQSAAMDAQNFSKQLQDCDLIEKTNIRRLLDKDATKAAFLEAVANILSSADVNDFVVIFFTGHATNNRENRDNSLIMYDYFFGGSADSSSEATGKISDVEFNAWIHSNARRNPTVILILDTHSGSTVWLNEDNPKHILLAASHTGQIVYELATGGFFTASLIKAISESKGLITYKNLYRKVCEDLQEKNSQLFVQTPLFRANTAWDNYIFKHKKINKVLPVQLLLKSFGYNVKEDGIDGPQTLTAKTEFMKEHGIFNDEKIRYYLDLKGTIQKAGRISILFISGETYPSLNAIFQEKDFVLSQYPIWKLVRGQQDAQQNPNFSHGNYEKNFIEILMKCTSIIVGLPNRIQEDIGIYGYFKVVTDIAFALDKEVLIFSENNRLPESIDSNYYSTLWETIPGNMIEDSALIVDKLTQYKNCLENLLRIKDTTRERLLDSSYYDDIERARTTNKLDLSNNNLTQIPEEVGSLFNLEELYLEGNNITKLFSAIGELKKLRVLNLNGNPISLLPREILELKRLEMLALSNTAIEELPVNIDELESLEELYIHSTKLVVLPDALANLRKLKILDARENHILNFPRSILNGRNSPKKLSTYVKTMQSQSSNLAGVILLGDEKNNMETLNNQIIKVLGKNRVRRYPGVATADVLYKSVRAGVADSCWVYINDCEALIEQFEFPKPENRNHNMLQFFKTLNAGPLNLFFDGSLVKNDFCNELTKIPGVNAVIALYASDIFKDKNYFPSAFFDLFVNGNSITGSFNSAKTQIRKNKTKNLFFYTLFKSEGFIDFQLPVQDKPGRSKRSDDGVAINASSILDDAFIANAQKTRTVDLEGRQLIVFPPEVFQLTNLETLDISNTSISAIPKEIVNLLSLKRFICNKNLVTELPVEFFNLVNLEEIEMNETALGFISSDINKLKNLTRFAFEHSYVKVIPRELIELDKLNSIVFSNNPIINVPRSMLKENRPARLREYFSKIDKVEQVVPVILYVKSIFRTTKSSETPDRSGVLENLVGYDVIAESNYHYKLLGHCETLAELTDFIVQNAWRTTIVIVDDQDGILAGQFGEGFAKYVSVRQYFNCFGLSLNIIYIGPLNSYDACADLVNSGEANLVIARNSDMAGSLQFVPLFFELLLKSELSLLGTLKFIEQYLFPPRSAMIGDASAGSKLGFDIYFNAQQFQDFHLLTERGVSNALPPLDVIRVSKYISPEANKEMSERIQQDDFKMNTPATSRKSSGNIPAKKSSVKTKSSGSAKTVTTKAASTQESIPKASVTIAAAKKGNPAKVSATKRSPSKVGISKTGATKASMTKGSPTKSSTVSIGNTTVAKKASSKKASTNKTSSKKASTKKSPVKKSSPVTKKVKAKPAPKSKAKKKSVPKKKVKHVARKK